LKRFDALRVVDDVFREVPLVLTCGATAREMASIARRDTHLPLLDSMGLTSAVGLGVALGRDDPVGIVDGDGSLLMGFSILPTLATWAPPNLTVVVLDNGQHASADGMPSQAASLDLAQAIGGCGIAVARAVTGTELRQALEAALESPSFSVVHTTLERGNTPGVEFLLEDPAVIAARFTAVAAGHEIVVSETR
jgi:thiamine pyrophosphate-dependent acetolactate synthase large subunit-like protein